MSVELQRRLFTVDEYHAMARAGVFDEDDRVELIEGEIVNVAAIGSRHAACVNRLTRLLTDTVGDRAIVSVQNPVRLSDLSEPEPDVALLRPREDFYASSHPTPDDVLLLVEVGEVSLKADREVKVPLYARASIPEVWLVDAGERAGEGPKEAAEDGPKPSAGGRAVEVYRSATPEGYGDIRRVEGHTTLRPQELSGVAIPVEAILG